MTTLFLPALPPVLLAGQERHVDVLLAARLSVLRAGMRNGFLEHLSAARLAEGPSDLPFTEHLHPVA